MRVGASASETWRTELPLPTADRGIQSRPEGESTCMPTAHSSESCKHLGGHDLEAQFKVRRHVNVFLLLSPATVVRRNDVLGFLQVH